MASRGPRLEPATSSDRRAIARGNEKYARQLKGHSLPYTVRVCCTPALLEEPLRGPADPAKGGASPGLTVSFSEMHSAEAGAFFAFRRRFTAPDGESDVALGSTAPPQVNAVAIMNFANGQTPGGGYLNGARAQEEALCRQFPLYHPSMSRAGSRCYPFGCCCGPASELYSSVLLTHGVECMRWDESNSFGAIEPQDNDAGRADGTPVVGDLGSGSSSTRDGVVTFRVGRQYPHPCYTCTMVGAAAPCLQARDGYDQEGIRGAITNAIMSPLVHGGDRALDGGLARPGRCLILGAWGCGAFGNNPAQMSRDFAAALSDAVRHHGRAAGFWDEIHFAVPAFRPSDRANTAAFRSEMQRFCRDVLGKPLVVYNSR